MKAEAMPKLMKNEALSWSYDHCTIIFIFSLLHEKQERMVMNQNLIFFFFTCLSLLIASLHFFQVCNANCTPSACGLIHNIKPPFRLKNDPQDCGDPSFELVCENNVASIILNSQKYHVKVINYSDFTIRLAYASIDNNTCSFPISSAYGDDYFYPYFLERQQSQAISLMSCEYPLHNCSLSNQVTGCGKSSTHTCIKAGQLRPADVEHMCTVDSIVATSWNFTDLNNVSLSEIHQSLLYGFKLSWFYFLCQNCSGPGCSIEPGGLVICGEHHSGLYYKWEQIMESFKPPEGPAAGRLMLFMLIVVRKTLNEERCVLAGYRKDIERILVVSYEVRFIVGMLLGMGFLIYKFRRRRLSSYEEIEGFLQSDNKLSPIRQGDSDFNGCSRNHRMGPNDRPSMNQVLAMLEADVERLQIPAYSSQSTHVAGNEEESWLTDSTEVSLLHHKNSSCVEITIS
ncbi:hypothetical protein SASPL_125287 [Salvia splendens]|uniref:Wall-associated receptor kinase galacturonan-binding domain-containing protein n=1 Tax=Salvia splendens TaxID=180675 RepID=A0A8X8ZQM1_SALSN|nr:hypothetical protein SASPL_125287 [Salvia splendens]